MSQRKLFIDVNRLAMGYNPASPVPPNSKPVLFFALYYDKATEPQFRYAAEHWLQQTAASSKIRPGKDKTLLLGFSTEDSFRRQWSALILSSKNRYEIWGGNILSHSTNDLNYVGRLSVGRQIQSGMHFKPSKDDDQHSPATLVRSEIISLLPLPWNHEIGYLVLSGCNTAVDEGRNWSPAKSFAQQQRIHVVGQTRTSSFSKSAIRHETILPGDRAIYLWAHDRDSRIDLVTSGVKLSNWSNKRLAGRVFKPV